MSTTPNSRGNSHLWGTIPVPKLTTLLCSLAIVSVELVQADTGAEIRTVDVPSITATNAFYVGNRQPLTPETFLKLPIGSIAPHGWLLRQLELEARGMTGHLEGISRWCKFDGNAWASPTGQGHSGWEELPYWLKGYGDLGYVLGNRAIIAEARKWLDSVLASQEADGWFGPRSLKTSLNGKPDLWPHMVMCNCLQSFYEFTGDPRVLPFLTRYFHFLNAQPAENFGEGYWPKMRFGDNIETAYWLYNQTGDASLLELARKIHEHMARWDSGIINWHNVNVAQGFREPGDFYQQAGDRNLLEGAERNYQQVMGQYGQFPGGGFAGDENCRPGFGDPRQGFETCGIVEFMHSFEMLTKISGNPIWADRCEELAFNSLPAALTPDLRGLHYLTCANQVQLDKNNKSPGVENDGTMFSYSPGAVYRCCQHNVSHGWPYYAEELWLATPDRGLCASLYAASEVKAKVGEGALVRISEQTDYPFGETVTFKFVMSQSTKFPLYLRFPRWCSAPAIEVNREKLHFNAHPLSYAVLERTWQTGDTVTLHLPMKLSVRRWEKNQTAASVDFGPLTFSLQIAEWWSRYGGTDAWPETELYARSPWNYGLVLEKKPEQSFELIRKQGPLAGQSFTPEAVPLQVKAKVRKIPAWQQDSLGLVAKLQPSPVKSSEPVETVTLIPMGAARLRITAFPVIGNGPDAHEWKKQE